MPPDPPQLDYSLPPARRRLWVRRTFLAVLACLLVAVGLRWGTGAYNLVVAHRRYRSCAAYSASASSVAYEDGGFTDGADLPTQVIPSEWVEFNAISSTRIRSYGTLFLHERRTPQGATRLVGVDLIGMGADGDSLELHGRVI